MSLGISVKRASVPIEAKILSPIEEIVIPSIGLLVSQANVPAPILGIKVVKASEVKEERSLGLSVVKGEQSPIINFRISNLKGLLDVVIIIDQELGKTRNAFFGCADFKALRNRLFIRLLKESQNE